MSATEPPLWDQHTCLPLESTADITELARYPVGSYLSVNVGYSPHSSSDTDAMLDDFLRKASVDGRFDLVSSVTDIDGARAAGRRALAFDLEDSGPLDGNLDNIRHFYTRGVRSLLPTYNHANAAGCGCLDAADTGLTRYGRDLVREMNEVGMFVDGSHCSAQTGRDICGATESPMIYSHSNFGSLWPHPRNITDEQARACASTGGVIGINGVGIFLGVYSAGERRERVEAMADHVEYGVDLVGIGHVGVGSDYSFDHEEFTAALVAHPEAFSDEYTKYGPLHWVPPEDTMTLPDVLRRRGFDEAAVGAVFGGNFRRVAAQVWK